MAIPGEHGHLDAHNQWLQFIDDVTNHKIYPGPAGPVGPAGPAGPDGPQGAKGNQGEGIHLRGYYDTYEKFIAEHPTGNEGDCYIVGKDLYVWDKTDNHWQDAGPSVGPQGPKGDAGAQGPAGSTGAAGAKGDTGSQGPAGAKGDTGSQGLVGATGAAGTDGAAGKDGVAAANNPLKYDPATHVLGLDQEQLNTTLDLRYTKTTDLNKKADLTGAAFTGAVTVVSPTDPKVGGARQIYVSTVVPTAIDGKDGDIWLVYSA